MPKSKIPAALVHYVAQGLIERSAPIKILPTLMREISSAPLPIDFFRAEGLSAPLSQWRFTDVHENTSFFTRLKEVFGRNGAHVTPKTWEELMTKEPHHPAAQLVLVPLVLDASEDILDSFELLPQWFASDGVLLFATLAAGGLPELVNAQPEWLELLTHWPNIMDAGAKLQALRFELPVLDIESVPLSYSDFEVFWADVQAFIPILNSFDIEVKDNWRSKLHRLFDQGLREISVQVLYAQVWQVQPPKQSSNTHTVSLESLTSQLEQRRTYQ